MTREVPERCSYCARKLSAKREPHRVKAYYEDGSDFVGHKSCWLEMRHPDDARVGHRRWDIH